MMKKSTLLMLALWLLLPAVVFAQYYPTLYNKDLRLKTNYSNPFVPVNVAISTAGNFEYYDSVNSVWVAPNTFAPGPTTRHMFLHVDTVYMTSNQTLNINSLYIDSNAVLVSKALTQGVDAGLRLGQTSLNIGDTVIVRNTATFGTKDTNNIRIDVNRDGIVYKLTGTNIFNLTRIKYTATTLAKCTFIIDNNVGLTFGLSTSATSVAFTNFPNSSTICSPIDTVNYVINSGKTVTLSDSALFHMSSNTTTVKGGQYSYNIFGTLDLSKTFRNSVLVPTDTFSSNVVMNINGGQLKIGKMLTLGDSTSTKGKLLLHITNNGRVTVGVDTALIMRNPAQVFSMDTTGIFRRYVNAVGNLFPIAMTDTGNNGITLSNAAGTSSDTFSVRIRDAANLTWPAVSLTKIVNREWKITEGTPGGSLLATQIKWLASDQAASFNPASSISVYAYTGARWKEYPATITGGGTRFNPYIASFSGLDSFQVLVVGNSGLAVANPTLVVTPVVLNPFVQGLGAPSAVQSYTVSGTYLTGPVYVKAPANYLISTSATGPFAATAGPLTPTAGTLATTTIYVELNAAAIGGAYTGVIVDSTAGSNNVNVAVTGNTYQPTITVTPAAAATPAGALTFAQTLGIPSAAQYVILNGQYLAGNTVITAPFSYQVKNGANGTFATSFTLPNLGTLTNDTVYIRLAATSTGYYNEQVNITSTSIALFYVYVNGTTTVPTTAATLATVGTDTAFVQYLGTPSPAQTLLVNGANLLSKIFVTPTIGYEVSVDSGATWISAATAASGDSVHYFAATVGVNLRIRLNAATIGFVPGSVTIGSAGVTPIVFNVTGTVYGATVVATPTSVTLTQNLGVLNTPTDTTGVQITAINVDTLSSAARDSVRIDNPNFQFSLDGGTTWNNGGSGRYALSTTNTYSISKRVLVRLNAPAVFAGTGLLIVSGAGFNSIAVTLNGTTIAPAMIPSSPALGLFTQGLNFPSPYIADTISGSYILSNVTYATSTGYEMSFDGGSTWVKTATGTVTAGTANNLKQVVLVRLNAPTTAAGTYIGTLTVTSLNAPTLVIPLNGTDHDTKVPTVTKDGISVYPNPASSQITVNHLAAKEGTVIEITSMDGRRVAQVAPLVNATTTNINVANLAAAHYIITISNGSEKYSVQFSKN